ncbi:hypothetical protein ACWCRD_43595 [Streptomyces sp. NPDC002092]
MTERASRAAADLHQHFQYPILRFRARGALYEAEHVLSGCQQVSVSFSGRTS